MHSKAVFPVAILAIIIGSLSAQEWDGQGTQFNAESILRNQVVLPFIFFPVIQQSFQSISFASYKYFLIKNRAI